MSAMAAPQLSEQETVLLTSTIEDNLSGLLIPPFAKVEGDASPASSAGYIPIQGVASVPAGQRPDSQTVEAFETLERDLADLASACSGLTAADQPSSDSEPAASLLDALLPPSQETRFDCHSDADAATSSSQTISHFSHEESPTMNAQAQPVSTDAANTRASVESAVSLRQSSALETDGVLHDVQSTLDSLAGMAHGLSQQKLEVVKMREALEERRLATLERERQLAEREERLGQLEQRLQEEKQGIERVAEHNAAVLAERSTALQALAETVDSRDRATNKRAEVLSQEQQSIDRQLNQLRARVQELDDREAGLQRQGSELADRFKQLLDAKERFGAIVKGFNETVRFNTTYSAISKTVGTGAEEA